MKRIFVAIISLVIFMKIAAVEAAANQDKVENSGNAHIVNFGYAAYDCISEEAVKWYANYAGLLIINDWQKDKMQAIKALNPNVICLVYKIALNKDYEGQGAGNYKWIDTAYPQWFLLDKNNKRITDGYDEYSRENVFVMNWGNLEWREYWCNSVLEEVIKDGWDGVFIDCVCEGISDYWAPNGVLQYKDNKSFAEAVEGFLAYCHKRFKKAGKLLIPNSVECVNHPGSWEKRLEVTDGGVDEGFVNIYGWWPGSLRRSEEEWERQISYLETTGGQNKIFFAISRTMHLNRQDLLYSVASFLLGARGCSNFFYNAGSEGYCYKNYIKEYEAFKDIYTADMGCPLLDRYKVQDVWQRDYSNGKVLVNNTADVQKIELGKFYKQLDGVLVKSIELEGYAGLILLNADVVKGEEER